MKRKLALFMAMVMTVGILSACGNSGSSKDAASKETTQSVSSETTEASSFVSSLPVTWNLTDIFESDDAWTKTYNEELKTIETFKEFKGTLNSAEGICKYIQAVYDGEFRENLNKLNIYAGLKASLNSTDKTANTMEANISSLQQKLSETLAFEEPELFELSLEERKALFEDPLLAPYAYAFREYTDENAVHYDEETNVALSQIRTLEGRAEESYETLLYSEQPYPEVTMPDGSVETADESLFNKVIYGDYDQETKLMVEEAFYGAAAPYANTYATLLNTSAMEYLAEAKLNGYDHVLDYILHTKDVERDVYENIKETVHELLPAFQEYLAALKEKKGLDTMYYPDTLSSSATLDKSFNYDEGVKEMKSALNILGEDYIDEVTAIVEGSHIDVYAASGKTTGAFETSCANKEIDPYILHNYTDDFNSVSTLCHEMGHAMYSHYSNTNEELNYTTNDPVIFTQEVASTNNEFLLNLYELNKTNDDEEKIYFLENMLTLMNSSIIRQMMYSEFEEYFYSVVEAGDSLSAEDLNDKWIELNKEYYGDAVEFPEGFECRWSQIPHFYYGYYVFSYATSATYAAAISQKIYNQEEGALDAYKEFLTLGASKKPSALLTVAGVDPLDDDTYSYLIDFYGSVIKQITDLYGN